MSNAENTILGLKLPTDPRWADLASLSLEDVLSDHAYCEQKATTQCITLIQAYHDRIELVEALAPIITEEWGHFRMVLAEMKKRGLTLGPQRRDEYVNLLIKHTPTYREDDKLLNKLLFSALIEARSCERFRLLSEHLEDAALRTFYYKFMVSEAGHYRLFIDLAEQYYPVEKVRTTWQKWLDMEAQVLLQLTPRGDRIH